MSFDALVLPATYSKLKYPLTTSHLQAKLPNFIAYALHRTKSHSFVSFAALVLLQRLKAQFPNNHGSSGHQRYISAFTIESKVICDDTYSNKSWSIVAQGMFTLWEINQMEREVCSYLDCRQSRRRVRAQARFPAQLVSNYLIFFLHLSK